MAMVDLSAVCDAAMSCSIVLHATAVVRRGRAELFLARSCGGKSTVAALCDGDGLKVLADEFALVLEKAPAFYVRPLPRQAQVPAALVPLGPRTRLGRVFFLEKATDPRVEPLSRVGAAGRCLKGNGVFGFRGWPPPRRLQALDRLIRLFRAVPAYVLHFRKDNSFWKVIDELDAKNELEEKERAECSGA